MNTRGLSLVELVTVLGIISVGSLVAVPAVLKWKTGADFRGTAARLVSSLQYARSYSYTNRELVVIDFHEKGYEIFVDNGEGNGHAGDWVRNGNERLLVAHQSPASVSIDTNFSSERFRFKGYGRNQPGSIFLNQSNLLNTRIVVNVLGRIRVEY
mgnify:FL=1